MRTDYPSNLSYEQYELLRELLPPPKPGGRPREVDMWEILNAIFYVLVEGIHWRSLPSDFPAWPTVYTYFRNWRLDGTWQRIQDRLYTWNRLELGRPGSPSEGIIDSQSVKTAAGVSEAVGYDGGKQLKGRKRFIVVDTLGWLLRVMVVAANVGEQTGGRLVLQRVKQMGQAVCRLHIIWADGGFSGAPFLEWVMETCRWVVQVVLRRQQTKGFQVVKKRWKVERTLGWLMHCRRLVRDYERLPETAETFIYLAMIRIMVRRLA